MIIARTARVVSSEFIDEENGIIAFFVQVDGLAGKTRMIFDMRKGEDQLNMGRLMMACGKPVILETEDIHNIDFVIAYNGRKIRDVSPLPVTTGATLH